MIENQTIEIKEELKWSNWIDWNYLVNCDVKKIPTSPGVYEVRSNDLKNCLDIGKAANLRNRMLGRLIRGIGKHSTRDRMKEKISNFDQLKVRWAMTGSPAAIEEYLHKEHKKLFNNKLPEFVIKT